MMQPTRGTHDPTYFHRSHSKEEDLYVADGPEVGTVSQGSTIDEALANLREVIDLYLEEFPPPEQSQPLLTEGS